MRKILYVFLFFIGSSAFAFKLTPMTATFAPTGTESVQTFVIENDSNEKIAIQISMTHRKMDILGNETHPDADRDFIVFPTQIILPGNARRSIRITWVGKKDIKEELPYRIIAEQLPVEGLKEKKKKGAVIELLLKYEGSVYIRPNNVHANVVVEKIAYQKEKGKEFLILDLSNNGNAHQLLNDPVLKITVGKTNIELNGKDLNGLNGQNILANSKRHFLIPWPQNLTSKEKLKAEIKLKP